MEGRSGKNDLPFCIRPCCDEPRDNFCIMSDIFGIFGFDVLINRIEKGNFGSLFC